MSALGAAVIAWLLGSRSSAEQQPSPKTDGQPMRPIDRLQAEQNIHLPIHSSLDVRSTVLVAVIVAVLSAVASLFKDNMSLMPSWGFVVLAIEVTVAAIFGCISTWVGIKGLSTKQESVEEVIKAASEELTEEELLRQAAVRVLALRNRSRLKAIGTQGLISATMLLVITFAWLLVFVAR